MQSRSIRRHYHSPPTPTHPQSHSGLPLEVKADAMLDRPPRSPPHLTHPPHPNPTPPHPTHSQHSLQPPLFTIPSQPPPMAPTPKTRIQHCRPCPLHAAPLTPRTISPYAHSYDVGVSAPRSSLCLVVRSQDLVDDATWHQAAHVPLGVPARERESTQVELLDTSLSSNSKCPHQIVGSR